MKAMILAAGYGTRLRPYSNHTPKPLFPIAGRPLIDDIIRRLEMAGCRAVMINTHHLHRQIEDFLAAQKYGLEIHVRHEPEILGTGGAIKNVADFWDSQPFMVINSDIVADVDLANIYARHCRRHPPATLVLCDDPTFNSVAVVKNKWITGFPGRAGGGCRTDCRLLTFTGIQVLEPLVLDHIPAGTPYSSIDAFKKILAAGRKLEAVVVPKDRWQDIGTPASYRRTAIEKSTPLAFEAAFGTACRNSVQRTKLKGDGSVRQWYRLTGGGKSLILADHGIRQTPLTSEVDAFVQIGRHLQRQGVCVPRIFFYDTFCGLVFLEDLGDRHLQQAVKGAAGTSEVIGLYRLVIEQLIRMSRRGADNFNAAWTYQTPVYDQKLILEKECRYFQEAFLNGYLGQGTRFEDLETEFVFLAENALQGATIGLMHRDMQSRNIMLKEDRVYFIDFQGGRLGPLQYDLASLLIDPYVALPQQVQDGLLEDCLEKLSAEAPVTPDKFRTCYRYCALARNLQILGAFAYLSRVAGKKQFEQYIPAAVKTLRSNLNNACQTEFPRLSATVEDICRQLKI